MHDLSYTFLDLYNWIQMINDCLNPSAQPVSEGQLDLVYLRGGEVCCTTTIQGISYFSLGRRSEPEEAEEEIYPEELAEEPEEERLPAPEEWITDIPGGKPAVTPPPFTMPTDDDWLTELKSGG